MVTIRLEAASVRGAAGEATVNHTADGWTIQLSVRGLKGDLSAGDFYEEWSSARITRPATLTS